MLWYTYVKGASHVLLLLCVGCIKEISLLCDVGLVRKSPYSKGLVLRQSLSPQPQPVFQQLQLSLYDVLGDIV